MFINVTNHVCSVHHKTVASSKHHLHNLLLTSVIAELEHLQDLDHKLTEGEPELKMWAL